MKLIDMKLSAKETKAMVEPVTLGNSKDKGPIYPWGLTIELEDESIKKLGIDFDTANTGKEYTATVQMKLKRKGDNEDDGRKSRSLSFQITKMVVEKGKFDLFVAQKKAGPGE